MRHRPGVVAAALLTACASRVTAQQLVRREFRELHMGMAVRIVLYAPDDAVARNAARAAFARIATLEDILSDHRPSSEVRRLTSAKSSTSVRVSPPLCEVLARALEIARASDGVFDPTVGPLVALWKRARHERRLPSTAELQSARRRVGHSKVFLDPARCTVTLGAADMRIDLGGIAKGYILDRARDELRRDGVSRVLLEAGGDIVVGDAPPDAPGWRISVTTTDSMIIESARALTNAALSTSGDTEQFVDIDGVRYSHIVDPRTGLGVTSGSMAWVLAPDATLADALATTFTIVSDSARALLLKRFPSAVAAVRRR